MSIYSQNRISGMNTEIKLESSYSDKTALGRTMLEVEQNAYSLFEGAIFDDMYEIKAINEGTLLEAEKSDGSAFYKKLKEAVQKLIAKITEIFESVYSYFVSTAMKTGKLVIKNKDGIMAKYDEAVKAKKTINIRKRNNNDINVDFVINHPSFKKVSNNSGKIIAATAATAAAIAGSVALANKGKAAKAASANESANLSAFIEAVEEDPRANLVNTILGAAVKYNGKDAAEKFNSLAVEFCFDAAKDVTFKSIKMEDIFDTISNGSTVVKELKKKESEIKAALKKEIAELDQDAKNSDGKKAEAARIRCVAKQQAATILTRGLIEVAKMEYRQAMKVIAALRTSSAKNESFMMFAEMDDMEIAAEFPTEAEDGLPEAPEVPEDEPIAGGEAAE